MPASRGLAGGKLPTERRLAPDLEVTRTMVRNALAVLEARGRRGACQADHVELVAALRAREPNRAEEPMDAHLRRVRGNLPGDGKRSQDDRAGGLIAPPTG